MLSPTCKWDTQPEHSGRKQHAHWDTPEQQILNRNGEPLLLGFGQKETGTGGLRGTSKQTGHSTLSLNFFTRSSYFLVILSNSSLTLLARLTPSSSPALLVSLLLFEDIIVSSTFPLACLDIRLVPLLSSSWSISSCTWGFSCQSWHQEITEAHLLEFLVHKETSMIRLIQHAPVYWCRLGSTVWTLGSPCLIYCSHPMNLQ